MLSSSLLKTLAGHSVLSGGVDMMALLFVPVNELVQLIVSGGYSYYIRMWAHALLVW